eukprot:CAMPEP_0176436410 /NCGR_PEP_ID=MMETSP0127-20121128/17954_1 /TAXON_ID=938130 /ORGANISM="Platyophrya macrostoma, Strain WH" /LENGTH=100 /DNA_ID=CAMNT_0017819729 /DNA_START=40 /DNA_END=342 /DNA_ORIENTATION=-
MGKTSYVKDWDKFFDAGIDLIISNPFKTRVQVKYKNPAALAILKITDDKKVLMHKCDNEEDFKKIEALIKAATQILTNYEQSDAGGKKEGGAKKKSKKRA